MLLKHGTVVVERRSENEKQRGKYKHETKFSEHVAFALFGILSQVFGKEEERVKKLDYGSIFLYLVILFS